MGTHRSSTLAPWRTRLIAFAVLIVIALVAIWLIDRRAITRMQEYRAQHDTHTEGAAAQHR